MPSNAYNSLDQRMKDLDQLLKAHAAITQFRLARKAAERAGGGLAEISKVGESLVSEPGRGRRSELDALNRAAMFLLSAHLLGFVEDLFRESAAVVLNSRVKALDVLVEQARSGFSNPHAYRVDRLFSSIGFPNITKGLSWKKSSNTSVKKRLSDYIEIRNRIAHGEQEKVRKAKVSQFLQFVRLFAKDLDEVVGKEIQSSIGTRPR